jgi:pSer/pThr/pTyr-binding forkhead associated (FHA) protein
MGATGLTPGARLVIQGPEGAVTSHPLEERTLIGRGEQCDVQLDDDRVSNDHVELARHGESYLLTDLGSLNGTVVNGRVVGSPQRLHNADVIQLGAHRLEVHLPLRVPTRLDRRSSVKLSTEELAFAIALAAPYRETSTFAPRPPTRAELAEQLHMSESTVKRRLDSLARKLHVSDAGPDRPRRIADRVIALGLDRS